MSWKQSIHETIKNPDIITKGAQDIGSWRASSMEDEIDCVMTGEIPIQ